MPGKKIIFYTLNYDIAFPVANTGTDNTVMQPLHFIITYLAIHLAYRLSASLPQNGLTRANGEFGAFFSRGGSPSHFMYVKLRIPEGEWLC